MSISNNDYEQYENELQLITSKYKEELLQIEKKDNPVAYNNTISDKDTQICKLKEIINRLEVENIQLKQQNAMQNQQLLSLESKIQYENHSNELIKNISQITKWNEEILEKTKKAEVNSPNNHNEGNMKIIMKIAVLLQRNMHFLKKCGFLNQNQSEKLKDYSNNFENEIDALGRLIDKMMNDNIDLVNQLSSLSYLKQIEEKYNQFKEKNEYLLHEINTLSYEKNNLLNNLYELQQTKQSEHCINKSNNNQKQLQSDNLDETIEINQQLETANENNTSMVLEENPLTNLQEKLKALENKFKEITKPAISDNIM